MSTRFDRWYSQRLNECNSQQLPLFNQSILEKSKASFDRLRDKYANNKPALDYSSATFELNYELLCQLYNLTLLSIDELWLEIEKMKEEINSNPTAEAKQPNCLQEYLPYTKDEQKIAITAYRKSQHLFSYQLPSVEVVDSIIEIAGNRDILELGSGAGLWAKLLQLRGVKLHATDYNPPPGLYADVERLEWRQAIEKYQSVDILLLIWPPPRDFFSEDLLNCLQSFRGKTVLFIGQLGQLTGGYQVARWLQSNVWKLVQQIPVYVAPHMQLTYDIQFYQFERV